MSARRERRNDDGAAAVEFALVVPLLLILVFGIISFGIVLAQQLALSNSARQAARFVVTQDRTCADVMNQVAGSAQTIGMDPSAVVTTVSVNGSGTAICGPAAGSFTAADEAKKPCANTPAGTSIRVETRYDSSLVIPLFVIDDSFTLTANGVYRCEYR